MSVESFLAFDKTMTLMDRQLDIWGQPCTVYIPNNKNFLGYEDSSPAQLQAQTGVEGVGTTYLRVNTKCHINFSVTKSVFYHFNWFPEDAEELCTAYFPNNSIIVEDSYLRTSQVGVTSSWGDLLFKVVKIQEDGIFKTLKRTYFLRPVSSQELMNLFALGDSGVLEIG